MSRRALDWVKAGAICGASLLSLSVAAGSALAADPPPQTAAAAPDSGEMEEVVVQTEKTKQDLQTVASSVTAIDAENLQKANVVEAADLSGLVPGLTIAKNEGYNRVVSIRGIGFETPQNDSAQTSVAYHVDGVYIVSPIALNADFLDVAQIEVARGPQGTVFGQNATGGTINLISNQPKLGETSGTASVSYGSYNLFRTEDVLNLPIGDTFALRGALLYSRHDGFSKATQVAGYPDGYDEDNANDVTARLTALWRPIDDLSVTFSANYYDTDQNERAEKSTLDPDPNPRLLSQDYPGKFAMRNEDYALTADYDLGFADIKSITSYQYLKQLQSISNARLSFAAEEQILGPNIGLGYGPDIIPDTHRGIQSETQEINLSSKPGNDLEWLLGAFYLHTKTSVYFIEYTYNGHNCVADLSCPVNPDPGGYSADFGFGPSFDSAGNGFESIAHPERTSFSFYGQGTYHITDYLSILAGARYSHDRLQSDPQNYFGPPTPLFGTANRVTERASLTYDFTPTNNVYFNFATGFKPGASNLESASNPPVLVPFVAQPETITSYEIGSKNDFFDKHVRVNLAAFYYDYTNFQFAAEDPIPFTGGVANIPKSTVYGLEAEASAILPYNFRLDGNLALERGIIDSHYLALDPVVGNAINISEILAGGYLGDSQDIAARIAAEQDVKGHALPKLPRVAINFSVLQTSDFGEHGSLTSRVQFSYHSHFAYRVFDNASTDEVPMALLVDLNFEYNPANSPWDFQFTITNLFDRTFVDSKYTDSFGVGSTSYEYDPPRQFIFKAAYKF